MASYFFRKNGISSLDYIYFEGDIEEMHYSFVLCVEKIK
jgi:hypothetical protein